MAETQAEEEEEELNRSKEKPMPASPSGSTKISTIAASAHWVPPGEGQLRRPSGSAQESATRRSGPRHVTRDGVIRPGTVRSLGSGIENIGPGGR